MTTPAEQAQDAARRARRRARLAGLTETEAGVAVDVEETPDEQHFRDLHNERYAADLDQATEQAGARSSAAKAAPKSEPPATATRQGSKAETKAEPKAKGPEVTRGAQSTATKRGK